MTAPRRLPAVREEQVSLPKSHCVHHTDDERKWGFDRDSSIGRPIKGPDETKPKDWIVVDVKNK
jgi:hypothetical protein